MPDPEQFWSALGTQGDNPQVVRTNGKEEVISSAEQYRRAHALGKSYAPLPLEQFLSPERLALALQQEKELGFFKDLDERGLYESYMQNQSQNAWKQSLGAQLSKEGVSPEAMGSFFNASFNPVSAPITAQGGQPISALVAQRNQPASSPPDQPRQSFRIIPGPNAGPPPRQIFSYPDAHPINIPDIIKDQMPEPMVRTQPQSFSASAPSAAPPQAITGQFQPQPYQPPKTIPIPELATGGNVSTQNNLFATMNGLQNRKTASPSTPNRQGFYGGFY